MALRAILETRHCDAIMLVGDTSDQPRLMEELRDSNFPVVGLWQGTMPTPGITIIGVDNRGGIDGLLDHLIGLGHRRIAFIGGAFQEGPLIGDIGERRVDVPRSPRPEGLDIPDGYVRDARTHSPAAPARRGAHGPPGSADRRRRLDRRSRDRALHGAAHLGMSVPGDVSIVGFDDLPIAEFTTPSLTTTCMPIAEMAAAGVKAAVGELKDRQIRSPSRSCARRS